MYNTLKAPIFLAFLSFLAGIVYFVNRPSESILSLAPFMVLFALLFLIHHLYRNPSQSFARIFTLLMVCLFFLLGLLRSHQQTLCYREDFAGQYLDSARAWVLVLSEEPLERERSYKVTGRITAVLLPSRQIPAEGRVLLYFAKDSSSAGLRYGDKLLLRPMISELDGPKNPNEFNYRKYLGFHQIYHRAFVKEGDYKILGNEGRLFFKKIYALRKYLSELLEEKLPSESARAVASALLLGQRDRVDEATIHNYSASGAMHVLAVSGLHVGIIFLILQLLIPEFSRSSIYSRFLRPFLFLAGIWSYAALTGLSPSVTRAATMFSFVIAGSVLDRKLNIYHSIAASAFFLLFIQPYLITEIGFLLSYFAVLGIVYIQPRLYSLLYFRNRLLDKAWAITAVSIAAQLATFPIAILFFYQFPVFFLISNLLVIPAAMLIVSGGVFLFLFSAIPSLGNALGYFLSAVIDLLNAGIALISRIPGVLAEGIVIDIPQTVLLYLFLLFLLLYFARKSFAHLRNALLFLILFVAFTQYRSIMNRQYQGLTIYRIRGHSAVAFFSHKSAWVLADSALLSDRNALRFHMRHHWWNRGIRQIQRIALDTMPESFAIQFGNQKIALHRLPAPGRGYLIRIGKAAGSNALYVLDESIDRRRREMLLKRLEKLKLPYVDLSRSNALSQTF